MQIWEFSKFFSFENKRIEPLEDTRFVKTIRDKKVQESDFNEILDCTVSDVKFNSTGKGRTDNEMIIRKTLQARYKTLGFYLKTPAYEISYDGILSYSVFAPIRRMDDT